MHSRIQHHCFQTSLRGALPIALALAFAIVAGCEDNKKPQMPAPRYQALPPKIVPEFLKGTIMERVDLAANEPAPVSGFGLVVGLDGTGGGPYAMMVREYMLKQMVKHGFGSKLHPEYEKTMPEDMLSGPQSNKFAIVRVDGFIPPGARINQRFDVMVSALPGSNTTSLSRGMLYGTDLLINGANTSAPGVAINIEATVPGQYLFVNPAYALEGPDSKGGSRDSLRTAMALDGGVVAKDRPLLLRLRQPEYRLSRTIENRLDQQFQALDTAQAKDEGLVGTYVPKQFGGDWEHFAGVVMHLYMNRSPEFNTLKARQLAEEAVKPNAPLLDISYAWEGLGNAAIPAIAPLMTHSDPQVAFAAVRAAAFIGDVSAQHVLMEIAGKEGHPFQITAIQTLGKLPPTASIAQMLRTLLNNPQNTVRIAAYEILADHEDNFIYSVAVADKFKLDIVPVSGPPMIYARRTGLPRIAIFGGKAALDLPATFTAMNNRLSITSREGEPTVTIFYRDLSGTRPKPLPSRPEIEELVRRLGGDGGAAQYGVDFSYGDIVAMLQAMADSRKLWSIASGQRVPVAFVLQDAPVLMDEIQRAPAIDAAPGRPQTEAPASVPRQVGSAQ